MNSKRIAFEPVWTNLGMKKELLIWKWEKLQLNRLSFLPMKNTLFQVPGWGKI
jgi:hypothetical protein